MATTSDLRTGIIIRYNGALHRVVDFHHHAPGNWRAMVIMKLKNMQTGKVIEDRVRAGSDIAPSEAIKTRGIRERPHGPVLSRVDDDPAPFRV